MDADHYPISQLVADVKRVCAEFEDERQILSHVRPLMRRAALSKASWLEPRMYSADAEQGFGVHLIHEEPDHTVAVLALSWAMNCGSSAWIFGFGKGPGAMQLNRTPRGPK